MSTNLRPRALTALLALPLGVLLAASGARAQQPPTAGFPVDSASPPSASPPATAPAPATPAPAPTPSAPAPAAPVPGPPGSAPATAPAPEAPAAPPAPAPATPAAPTATPAPAPDAAAPPPPAPGIPFTTWAAPRPVDGGAVPQRPTLVEIELADDPGWSIGLDAFAGLSTLFGTDTRGAYSLAGGTLRGRFRYYEAGAYFEATDTLSGGGSWQNVGGFAGAWLPFRNWVDFEIAARLGGRRFIDRDLRFGSSGYELWSPALGLVLGVSDRAAKGTWGGRIGSQLVATYDLKQRDRPWQLTSVDADTGAERVTFGKSHVGGFSLELVVTLGFDVGEGA